MAELYDKARAGYPEAVIDDVLAFAGAEAPVPRALEVGAGTGKATTAMAARGLDVLALEPDAAMAAVARRNCRSFANVRLERTTFEDWQPGADPYDLVYSAQAWHWVDPEVRWSKAATALAPAGTLALFWHRTDWGGEELRDELDDVYRRAAPVLRAQEPGFPLGPPLVDDPWLEEMRSSGLFTATTSRAHQWSATFTADGFIELLLTQSHHRLAAEDERLPLFDALRELIARRGGEMVVPSATVLVLGRRRRRR